MFWYFLRVIFYPYTKIFFRRSQGKNLHYLRVKNPILIAINHPNAFMDPIALSTVLGSPRTYYMARGDAFKKGIVSTILTATGIIPIFRMRDAGIEGVKKNNDSFSIAYNMWNKNRKIMVFAEGLCIQERRLRPIQKGTARMAFGFMEEFKREDFLIVPVSLNYSHLSHSNGDLYCHIGEPISVKDYIPLYKENSAKAVNELTRTIEARMKELLPHLLHKENDRVIEELQSVYKHQFISENKLDSSNLENHQKYWFKVVELLNSVTENHPEKAAALREATSTYKEKLKQNNLQDVSIYNSLINKRISPADILKLILGLPFYAIGKLINLIPWLLAKVIADKTAKNVEFYKSVKYGTSAFLSIFYLIAELLVLWFLFRVWWYLPLYFVLKIALGTFALKFSPFMNEMFSHFRANVVKKKNPTLFNGLVSQRNEILSNLTAN